MVIGHYDSMTPSMETGVLDARGRAQGSFGLGTLKMSFILYTSFQHLIQKISALTSLVTVLSAMLPIVTENEESGRNSIDYGCYYVNMQVLFVF